MTDVKACYGEMIKSKAKVKKKKTFKKPSKRTKKFLNVTVNISLQNMFLIFSQFTQKLSNVGLGDKDQVVPNGRNRW